MIKFLIAVNMASKIVKLAGAQPDELELSIAQVLLDLESSVPESRIVTITAAKEVKTYS